MNASNSNPPPFIGGGGYFTIVKLNIKRKTARVQVRQPDRKVTAPAAVGRIVKSIPGSRVAKMGGNGRVVTITHTERFASVQAPNEFYLVKSYAANPGVGAMFPWCSAIANRFDKYKFRKLSFRYIPQCATISGLVTLAFDFDPEDNPPDDMTQATVYNDYVSTSVWQAVSLVPDLVNGDRLPQKNTRPGNVTAGTLNTYDVGTLHVCTSGFTGTVGYIEVSYVVDLFIHQLDSVMGGSGRATPTHLQKLFSDLVPAPRAFLPGYVEISGSGIEGGFRFTQPFEGLIIMRGLGVGFTGTTLGTSSGIVGSVRTITISSDLKNMVATYVIRAKTGDLWRPYFEGDSVEMMKVAFVTADYESLSTWTNLTL